MNDCSVLQLLEEAIHDEVASFHDHHSFRAVVELVSIDALFSNEVALLSRVVPTAFNAT